MNTTPRAFRLFAATLAVAVTFGLLGTVTKIAEPQAGVLLAKQQQQQQQQQMLAKQASSVKVAMVR